MVGQIRHLILEGVRLGTAEIYSEVERFIEIKESIVVGQHGIMILELFYL